jgi:hypothetical protein
MVSSGFLQEPHGVTTQKTQFVIVTAVKTSNLTQIFMILFIVRYHGALYCTDVTESVSKRAYCHVYYNIQFTTIVSMEFPLFVF